MTLQQRYNYICVLGWIIVSFSAAAAQIPTAPEADDEGQARLYLLRSRYIPNIVNTYVVEEQSTTVREKLADSTVQRFDRNVKKHLSLRCMGNETDGTYRLKGIMDSIEYQCSIFPPIAKSDFQQKKGTQKSIDYRYHSEQSGKEPPVIWDFDATTALLNREFYFTQSPYAEFTRLESEQIDWLKDYVVRVGKNMIDTVKKFVWLDAITPEAVEALIHPERNIILQSQIAPDSVFSRPISVRINNTVFQATGSKISVQEFANKVFTIKAEAVAKPTAKQRYFSFANTSTFERVLDGTCSITITLKLDKAGVVRSSVTQAKATLTVEAANGNFKEEVDFSHTMTLSGQYQW